MVPTRIAVITGIEKPEGNKADKLLFAHPEYGMFVGIPDGSDERFSLEGDVTYDVFTVGEILLLDVNGRECGYPGRKPDKWDVSWEEFELGDWERAAQRAEAVLAEHRERGK